MVCEITREIWQVHLARQVLWPCPFQWMICPTKCQTMGVIWGNALFVIKRTPRFIKMGVIGNSMIQKLFGSLSTDLLHHWCIDNANWFNHSNRMLHVHSHCPLWIIAFDLLFCVSANRVHSQPSRDSHHGQWRWSAESVQSRHQEEEQERSLTGHEKRERNNKWRWGAGIIEEN